MTWNEDWDGGGQPAETSQFPELEPAMPSEPPLSAGFLARGADPGFPTDWTGGAPSRAAADPYLATAGARDEPTPELAPPEASGVLPSPVEIPSAIAPVAAPDGGSFSDRYRGTQWGQAADAQPQVAPVTGGGTRSKGLALGGGLVALAAVGVLAVTLLGGNGNGPGVPAGAVRLPVGSGDPNESSPTGPVTKTGVVNAFLGRVTAKNFGYAVEFSAAFTATEYMGYEVASMSGAMDIRGQDFSGNWRVHLITGKNAEVAMVYKGKNGYVRLPEENWVCAAAKAPRPQVNAFAGIAKPADLRYEGIKTKNGARLHQLRAVSPLRINPWVLQDPEWAEASSIKALIYDVFVTDNGTPVTATFTARIRVPDVDNVGKTEVKIVADYRFRNVGRPVTIKAPSDVCKTSAPA